MSLRSSLGSTRSNLAEIQHRLPWSHSGWFKLLHYTVLQHRPEAAVAVAAAGDEPARRRSETHFQPRTGEVVPGGYSGGICSFHSATTADGHSHRDCVFPAPPPSHTMVTEAEGYRIHLSANAIRPSRGEI